MKYLLTTAATALVLGTATYAQEADTSTSMGLGDVTVGETDYFASNLIGMRLYASETELSDDDATIDMANSEWDDIGEINDLIVSEDGSIQAVIVGVGGFLGIGEKDVAVAMDQVHTYADENGERFMVINTTADALEAAPAFEMNLDGDDASAEASADAGAMATDDAAMATDDAAMADAETDAVVTEEPATETADATEEMSTEETATDDAAMADAETDAVVTEEPAVETADAEADAAATDEMATEDTAMADADAEAVVTEEPATETAEVETEEMATDDAAMAEADATDDAAMATETDMAAADPAADDAAMATSPLEGYSEVAIADMTADELTGTKVYGVDDQNIGEIGDLVVAEDGSITDAIIDVGGFLGLGEKPVSVSFDDLTLLSNEDGSDIRVQMNATEDDLKALPRFEG